MQQSYQNNLNIQQNVNFQIPKDSHLIKDIQTQEGIGFDDEEKLRKLQRIKYKEDLDYLINLRQQNKIPVNNENELKNEYHKIQQMNDVS